MGSSIIELYMDGYDEGKDDFVDAVKPHTHSRKKNAATERVSARRKKAYFKSKKRMEQLAYVDGYTPSAEDKCVVQGMLRKHQLPMNECDTTYGCSIGNKRRLDASDAQICEHLADVI
jgi:hypothetical protein